MNKIIHHLRPYLFFTLFISFALITLVKVTSAADQTITCDTNGCDGSGSPLFSVSNLIPGESVEKTLTVVNNRDETLSAFLSANNQDDSGNILHNVLRISIKSNGTSIYTDTLANFLNLSSPVSLGNIPKSNSQNYQMLISFDIEAGNEYQGKSTDFDLSVNLSGSGVDTDTAQDGGIGGVTASNNGNPQPTQCSAQMPGSTPILSILSTTDSSITLTWTPVNPVTHYMIRFGTASGDYAFGADNVGDVTQFTVESLSSNRDYYFQVAGVNDCMPGSWSNEARGTTASRVLGLVTINQTQVLGVESEEPSVLGISNLPGQVAGDSTCQQVLWWLPLLVEAIVLGIYLLLTNRHGRPIRFWVVPVLLLVLSQIAHLLLGCGCNSSFLCRQYWLWNIGIVLLGLTAHSATRRLTLKRLT